MAKKSYKRNEIAEVQDSCKRILTQVLMDYVRLHGKEATLETCHMFRQAGEDGRVLKVLDFGDRALILYIVEDEHERQWLMFFGDDRQRPVSESLLNMSLESVNAIADIVKTI